MSCISRGDPGDVCSCPRTQKTQRKLGSKLKPRQDIPIWGDIASISRSSDPCPSWSGADTRDTSCIFKSCFSASLIFPRAQSLSGAVPLHPPCSVLRPPQLQGSVARLWGQSAGGALKDFKWKWLERKGTERRDAVTRRGRACGDRDGDGDRGLPAEHRALPSRVPRTRADQRDPNAVAR